MFSAVLCLPPVTRAIGITAPVVLAIIGVHMAWTLAVMLVICPSTISTPIRFHIGLAGSLVINAAITVAFPALGGDPRSPLWMIAVMYACFSGTMQEIEPSIGVLLIHALMPLIAIPILLVEGATGGWVFGAPLLCSVVSATGYNHLAQASASERQARRDNDTRMAELRMKLEEDERARLARDIHDSLGSSLAVVGLYGDLIERHATRPDQLRAIAGMVAEAANEGSLELSALIGAIMPASADIDGIVATLADTGRRAAHSSGAIIDFRVLRGGTVELDGAVRLALVRVFQESLHNAIEHGAVTYVDVSFAGDDQRVSLEIADDGSGFDVTTATVGSGLRGMRARAVELGGMFSVTSAPGAGTRVAVTLPRTRSSV